MSIVGLQQYGQVIVESAMQGPPGKQGIPGPAGGAAFIRVAATALSALVVVWEDSAGLVRPLIDLLARPWERDHCRTAFESERLQKHLPKEYRP